MLIAGNWKMNGLAASLAEVTALRVALDARPNAADVLVCPPASLLSRLAAVAGPRIAVGGQDCHAKVSGAYTGDISAEMLADAGAAWVIVGHSERRQYHAESDALIAEKAKAGWRAGLKVIVCVGELETERLAGKAEDVVGAQLSFLPEGATADNLVVAYEPVWAIGTGRIPTIPDIAAMHDFIRARLEAKYGVVGAKTLILYGGSVKPNNAREIFTVKNVGGALVGGASLKAKDFLVIIDAVAA
jgi:triosephosphate isomerase (TIM)